MNDKRLVEIRNVWEQSLRMFCEANSNSVKHHCCVQASAIIDEVFSDLNWSLHADDESIVVFLRNDEGVVIRKADFENFGALIMAMRGATQNNIKIEQEEYFELFELLGKQDDMNLFMERFIEFKDRNAIIS